MKDGDILVAKLNLKRLTEARNLLEQEIQDITSRLYKNLPLEKLPRYNHYLDSLLDTTEN